MRIIKLGYLQIILMCVFLSFCLFVKAGNKEIPQNEIWYTSSDNKIVRPNPKAFSQSIISNTYQNGKGIIVFNKDIITIGMSAFKGSETLASIQIPEGVETIGRRAFADCIALSDISLPNSLLSIKIEAFSNCEKLESIDLPENVAKIESGAFYQCKLLNSIAIPPKITVINNQTFAECSSLRDVLLSDRLTEIGSQSFYQCKELASIILPESTKRIGEYAFYECAKLTDIRIPSKIKYLGDGAFAGCNNLTRFHGDSITSDGRCVIINGYLKAFAPKGIKTYILPKNITKIAVSAFQSCDSIQQLHITGTIEFLGSKAFSDCTSLEEVYIDEIIEEMEPGAFSNCSHLQKIYSPQSTRDYRCLILDGVLMSFAPYGIKEYKIPNRVTRIGKQAFEECNNLNSIIFPNSLEVIRSEAFLNCKSLCNLTMPSSLTLIKKDAFKGCESLTKITIHALMPPELENPREFDYLENLYVPKKSLELYKKAPSWSGYFDKMLITK